MNDTRRIQTFIGVMILAAVTAAGYAGFASHSLHAYFALAVLTLAATTSRMKVKLPGINGNMSVNLPFLVIAIVNLSAAEAVAIACASTVVQCWPQKELLLATATLFLGQTAPVATIVALSEGKTTGPIWWNLARLSFPYYVISAAMASMVQQASSHVGWELALAVFPVMYGIHRSYELYFGNVADARRTYVFARANAGA